ncbi:MAG TPA: exodeoxyribonuclease VII small subunit [Bellilinea sp.]|nr:exodeoxyribonuclease VII small subunit [Bellilinea sp.]
MKFTPADELTYEQAMQELDDLIGSLEEGQSSLEDSLALYERGQALAKRCAELLDKAELRVQQLSADKLDLPVEPADE